MSNSVLVHRVADTTSRRDRDEIDLAVSRLLQQYLNAPSVSLLRLIDDGPIKRLVRRATVSAGSDEVGADSVRTPEELPALSSMSALQDCVDRNDIVRCTNTDGGATTVFPIEGERSVIGMLVIESYAALGARDVDLVGGILRILENHFDLLEYGERDTLTTLLNRKTFEAQFAKLHQRRVETHEKEKDRRAPNPKEPSWLALLDIDKFKSINDTHGHLFGDEVLLLTSQLMKRNFRGADQLFRFGGEEFVIILDHASETGAQIALERLRVMIETHSFPQVGRVTISIGYTQILEKDMSTLCVERADEALYYAKSHGRNNVRNYEALVAQGELHPKSKDGGVELF
jgi:diguanylate cyclase (GGDEF)-like protein